MIWPEIAAAFRWWFLLLLLGAAAFPAVFFIFRRLPDRGYAFTKMAGLLLAAYFFWIAGSLGFLGNNSGGALVSLLAVALFSFFLLRWARKTPDSLAGPSLYEWLSANLRQILLTELVFALLFALWVWVRSQNPAIAATEKPMEFAFLNAIERSPSFPPLDPWLSGFAISYYYFGYIMTSLISRLAVVPSSIAFNLAIAWLFAGAGTGAFGLVYNLLRSQGAQTSARLLGLVAAIALPLAGNLTIGLEIAHANGMGTPEFWEWLDVRDLNQPPDPQSPPRYQGSGWWWWRSSRPLREYHLSGRVEDGLEPIAEFPSFSFVLGDLHPHVLALPFAFLSLALALAWWLPCRSPTGDDPPAGGDQAAAAWWSTIKNLVHSIGLPLWLFTALVLGGLAFLNTWDLLIHLFVFLGAFTLARSRDQGWHWRLLAQAALVGVLLLIPAFLLYLPFFLGFRSQAGAPYLLPMLMRPTRLVQFLIIFGMPLFAIILFMGAQLFRQHFRYWRSGLLITLGLPLALLLIAFLFGLIVAASPEGAERVSSLATELNITLAPRPADQTVSLGWGISSISAILPDYLAARFTYPALTLLLAALIGMSVMIWREQLGANSAAMEAETWQNPGDVLPFVLLLITTAALLTIGPEFLFLRDNFGQRLNTIFKFYYQAWVLFGVAALYAIGYLWLTFQGRTAGHKTSPVVPAVATAGYTLLLLIALLFPIYAVSSRTLEYRGPAAAVDRQPPTLDGLAQMNRFNPGDYAAVDWLRKNVDGMPVILEAIGGQYSSFGRISAATGLPTLLGWAGHEYQWRGSTPEPAVREPLVRDVYSLPDLAPVASLLDEYGVQYIVVGDLERNTYGSVGEVKFVENLLVAFESNGTTIYLWQPQ